MKRRKRFGIVIGVAAAGVIAFGAQTAAATYNTRLTIAQDRGGLFHGRVESGDRKKCEVGRRVTLFKQRPGADRKLGTSKSQRPNVWGVRVPQAKAGWHVYATVSPNAVCSGDRSPIWTV